VTARAHAVKARNRRRGAGYAHLPVWWVFCDSVRLPDPRAVIARLPPGLCGVVLRGMSDPALVREIAILCRARRVVLTLAGDWRLAKIAGGQHLRQSLRERRRVGGFATASAHNLLELRRAARNGAYLVFLSPLYATGRHVGVFGLGGRGWSGMARLSAIPVAALGGIGGGGKLPKRAAGFGGIGGFGGE